MNYWVALYADCKVARRCVSFPAPSVRCSVFYQAVRPSTIQRFPIVASWTGRHGLTSGAIVPSAHTTERFLPIAELGSVPCTTGTTFDAA